MAEFSAIGACGDVPLQFAATTGTCGEGRCRAKEGQHGCKCRGGGGGHRGWTGVGLWILKGELPPLGRAPLVCGPGDPGVKDMLLVFKCSHTPLASGYLNPRP